MTHSPSPSTAEYLLKHGWFEQPPYHKDASMWFNSEVDNTRSFSMPEAYRIELDWQAHLAKEDLENVKLCPKCGDTWSVDNP